MVSSVILTTFAVVLAAETVSSRSLHDQLKMARWAQSTADDRMIFDHHDMNRLEHEEHALDMVNTIGSIKGRAILARQKGNYRVDEHGVPHSILPFTGENHEVQRMTSQRAWSPLHQKLLAPGIL
ncbi:hypothetical protein PFISCL1PPCAC_6457 [Pristionchus fissidentatus]|uniref:Uncharacterized protein n=1 Tax=Pristionchus fissidentatus TaxID=1538716 RepID=A0AAV5V9C1_9BILA|nr:hypothetical protein PFISCL1PPCAC_6457 [Pristionchus fissidentatus]